MKNKTTVFDPVITYPDDTYYQRFNRLIGLDDYKNRLKKILSILVNPEGIQKWVNEYHPKAMNVINTLLKRPPLVVLEGDVGTGKTELATTIGDIIARNEGIEIYLFPLSLSTRGRGLVGEMTNLISDAFDEVIEQAKKYKSESGKARSGILLLVDEADALAQSREGQQMHHEDKAGVNAFIRGIDRLGNGELPVAVIMCTNRLNALDPAIKRRAAEILKFSRPTKEQRAMVLSSSLNVLGFSEEEVNSICTATGATENTPYGFTFSDLTQRLLPTIILDAFPDQAVNYTKALEITLSMDPTPPFIDNGI